MMKIFLAILFCFSGAVTAGEKLAYQNWVVELTGHSNEAYTVADANSSLGVYCAADQCLFYLRQGLNCSPGAKYSVLMNSSSISNALTMECTSINGNIFQILTPFDAVLRATQVGESLGFAVALQSGAFGVTRFSLTGAKLAIDRVLSEAAKTKTPRGMELQAIPGPQILIVPPVQIVPQEPQKLPPKAPKSQLKKSGSTDISI